MVDLGTASQDLNINSSLGGNRIAVLSDSFGAQNGGRQSGYPQAYSSTTGVVSMLEALSFGRFTMSIDLLFATLGHTTANMAARYDTDIAGNYDKFDILWLDGGRNDGHASKADGDTTIANLTAMATKALRAGKTVFIPTPNPPRSYQISNDTQRKVRGYVNREVKKWCVGRRGVVYIDLWRDWADPTVSTGAAASGILVDNLHPDVTGAVFAARRVIDTCGFAFPLPYREQSAWDWYDATYNPTGNLLALRSTSLPRLAGTGGSISTFTGDVADGFTLSRPSGSGSGTEVVASKESAVAGYGSEGGERQVLTISELSDAAGMNFATDINGSPPAGVKGAYVFGQIEAEVSDLVQCKALTLYIQYWNGSANVASYALNNGSGGVIPFPDGKVMLRTPPLLVTPNAENLQFILFAAFNAGGSGVIKLGAPGIWVTP